jgi:hypothetical protein
MGCIREPLYNTLGRYKISGGHQPKPKQTTYQPKWVYKQFKIQQKLSKKNRSTSAHNTSTLQQTRVRVRNQTAKEMYCESLQHKTTNKLAANTNRFTCQQPVAINQSKQHRSFRVKLSKHSKPKNEF